MGFQTNVRVIFSLLIMEDDPELLEDLESLVPRRLPGTEVFTAKTIEEALRILEGGVKPTLGILDARVPASKGLDDKADPRVADRLHDLGIASICMTGYLYTEDVIEYLNRRKLSSPPLVVIAKSTDPAFVTQLFSEVRNYFTERASREISKSLIRVFEGGLDDGMARSGTAAIMSLQQEIIAYWFYLNEQTRTQVRRWFEIELDDHDQITRLGI